MEFFIDDVLTAVDGSFPFEFRYSVPSRADRDRFVLRAVAIDTAGLRASTGSRVLEIVEDATPPRVVRVSPRAAGRNVETITVFFNEPMDAASLTRQALKVFQAGEDGVPLTVDDVAIGTRSVGWDEVSNSATVRTDFSELADGWYAGLVKDTVSDVAGNRIAENYRWRFYVGESSIVWTSASDGDWDDAQNWNTDRAPIASDDVLIDVVPDVTATLSSTAQVFSLSLAETLALNGTLQVDGAVGGRGLVELRGSLAFPGSLDPELAIEFHGGRLADAIIPAEMDVSFPGHGTLAAVTFGTEASLSGCRDADDRGRSRRRRPDRRLLDV